MTKWRIMVPISLLLLFLVVPFQAHAETLPENQVYVPRERVLEVAKELHPPGCTDSMTADYCMLYSAYDLREEIRGMLAQGKSKDQVIDELVQKYGDRILAAPPAKGFHWLAWMLPGAAILVGGLLIGVLVFFWVRKSGSVFKHEPTHAEATIPSEKQEQVQEELKRWL